MTASRILKLECDYPLCASVFERHVEDTAVARRDAAAKGWSVQHGELDFCAHHPELKKHNVTLIKLAESYGTEYFTVSCNCGWKREEKEPPSWRTEGGTLKSIVLRDWAHHMPYEESALCQRRRTAARKKEREALYRQIEEQNAARAASREQEAPPAP